MISIPDYKFESLLYALGATLMIALVELIMIVMLVSCRRVSPDGYGSAVSTGTGNFAFRLSVDGEGRTLTLDLTKKPDEGPYFMDYTIDGDLSLSLDGFESGGEVPFPGFDTRASFVLPSLEQGSHTVEVTLRRGRDSQSASVSFETRGGGDAPEEVKCERLTVGISTSIYEGNELPFVVAVSPEECTQEVTWTCSNGAAVSIRHDEEWDEWFVKGLKAGTAEVVFCCGEKRVRKIITVLKKQ